jgi:hypothetical protein
LEGVAAIVSDPPYGIAWRMHGGGVGTTRTRKHGGIQNDGSCAARDWLMEVATVPAAIFGSFRAPWPTVELRQVLVYQKSTNAGLIGSVTGFRTDAEPIFLVGPWPLRAAHSSSVLRTAMSVDASGTAHPHEKPVDVIARLLQAAPPGTVLDPFAGSGSTLVAAKNLGRKAIGIEIEERWCAEAARRCSQEVLGLSA